MTMTEERPASPPNDLEAEESLLGAMMLSRGAVELALDLLAAADFYKPAHRAIFAAIGAMHAMEKPVDPITLADALGDDVLAQIGGTQTLHRIQNSTPASANAPTYAQIIGEHAAARRAWRFGSELIDAAREEDHEGIARLARDAEHRLASPAMAVDPAEDIALLVEDTELVERRFVIDGILARGEVVLLTGEPGHGKTTLMRQIQVQAAMGRHPFNRTEQEPMKTLYVDLQDPKDQIGAEFRRFLDGPARSYDRTSRRLLIKRRQQGLDLTTVRDARWLDALVARERPDLLLLGPIYRCYRGQDGGAGKASEEAADAVADVFSRLMVRYDLALILEGHSPHDASKMDYRPRGSHLWMDWPTFGFGLAPVRAKRRPDETEEEAAAPIRKGVAGAPMIPRYRLVSWRGPRDRGRPWPEVLHAVGFGDGGWPWRPPDTDPATQAGTTTQGQLGDEEPF